MDTVVNIEDNDLLSKNKNDVSRGDLLLGIFQKTTSPRTFDFEKEIEKDFTEIQRKTQRLHSQVDATPKVSRYKESREKSRESMTKGKLAKEVKLIRMFPGPAGLVPDVKNDNISATLSYLSSVDQLENKMATKINRRIEIKSQDEKNLAGEKAWKLLLNDLPNNFLQDYKISVVKDKANASHCASMKVRFIAGVLEYIDHSQDDPFVVLKDTTGSIEGTIHRDILLTYPGILEPNVVIFLCNVGLLKTTTYVLTNKYHILVSLVNLLAIYSDKGQIVSTNLMESILSRASSNDELNRINDNTPESVLEPRYISGLQKQVVLDASSNALLQTSSSILDSSSTTNLNHESELTKNSLLQNRQTNEKYKNCEKAFKNDKNDKNTDEMFGCFNYSMDIDDLDMDVFFTVDCEFTTLEEQNSHDRSHSQSISQTEKRHLKNTKKESTINVEKQIKEQHLSQTLQKCITDVKTCDSHTRHSRKNDFSSYDDTAYRDSNLNVKSTLSMIKRNVEKSETLVSYFADDRIDEYDSDDEILSQFDVDNIFDKSKKDC
ncbi:uncharacterized protein LOC120359926 isoform X2 [Solenopsis invicta]|nr:uncharacterized protein LOC105202495 isoform X2 [Solenopsis invicta]XP_039307224.1 uncharacterized protein LOC105202495 isoform X2 [Solenopsis invicta]XP_039315316.1 uncharacterized protein LOC120359926 isoform X2 [Solenopsis invicta]XP_039315317.1 uncharacterized protein LOC120359926 isoform X2 [Solenopsis invicta]